MAYAKGVINLFPNESVVRFCSVAFSASVMIVTLTASFKLHLLSVDVSVCVSLQL